MRWCACGPWAQVTADGDAAMRNWNGGDSKRMRLARERGRRQWWVDSSMGDILRCAPAKSEREDNFNVPCRRLGESGSDWLRAIATGQIDSIDCSTHVTSSPRVPSISYSRGVLRGVTLE